MKDLIKIEINENQEPVVNGRELYEALGIQTRYDTWFNRMKEYGFAENVDYVEINEKVDAQKRARTYEQINHAIKLDMAKEIAMIQRNEKGKEVRQYFIQVEKDFNSPEKIMARALKIAENKLNVLQLENAEQKKTLEEQKPKVIFANSVETAKTSILVGELAKIIKQNGYDIGQNRFFEWLRNNNYLISRKGTDYNMPTQKAMELGLFEIKETSITHADGHISVNKTPKVTGKGQVYFVNKFLKEVV
jgi:anti-repressor protein